MNYSPEDINVINDENKLETYDEQQTEESTLVW